MNARNQPLIPHPETNISDFADEARLLNADIHFNIYRNAISFRPTSL